MNAELIKALRYCAEHEGCDYYIAKDCPRESTWMCGVDCGQILMLDAAAALKAADKRIAELEAQEPTEKQVVDYCRKRCLVIVEEELFQRMKATFSQMPKEGEWQWLSSTYDRVPCEMRYVCSVCHHQEITHYDKPWNYCPNCGSKMRGEHDDKA